MTSAHAIRFAYGQPEPAIRSPRSLEYDLIARVTQHLVSAWANRDKGFPALAAALHDNNRLWSTLAADVAEPGNGLPAPLRAQLFYLFQFTAEHSRAVLNDGASAEVLIDINTAVMRGLRGPGPDIGQEPRP